MSSDPKPLVLINFDKKYLLFSIPVIILLNGSIIVIFAANKSLRNIIANFFVCSLACSDILVGIILIPTIVYGNLVVIGGFIMYTLMVSLLTLAICTYDRYVAVTRPFEYVNIMTLKRVLVYLATTWIVPIAFATAPTAWIQYGRTSNYQRIYLGIVICFMLVVAVMSIIAYGIIFQIGRRHITNIIRTEISGTLDRRRISVRRVKLEIKFVKLFAFLSTSFIIFWFPTCYINFVDDVLAKPELLPPIWFNQLSFLWLLLSSIINPFIYGLFQHQFRTIIKDRINRLHCIKRSRINPKRSNTNNFHSDLVVSSRRTNRINPLIFPDQKHVISETSSKPNRVYMKVTENEE